MKPLVQAPVTLVLLAAMTPLAGFAAPADDLMDSAHLWQARNQPELVRLAVAKALLADPAHAEALLLQAQFDLKAGNQKRVQQRLAALQRLHPDSSALRQLQALLRLAQGEGRLFSAAQSMARTGRVEEAVATARRVFPDGPPGGDLSLQYYQILSASPAHWREATTGFQRLVAESPHDTRYQLALARHLIEREATRGQGLQMVSRLAQQDAGDTTALRDSWRDGLLRQAPRQASLANVDAYLARNPDDAELRRWRAELARRVAQAAAVERLRHDPFVIRRTQLLATLADGHEDASTERDLLAQAEARPDDAEVQGGLGRLRMRQGRHAEAIPYFRRAASLDAGGRGKWRDLATTAGFWAQLRQARDQREAGAFNDALQHVDAALALKPAQPDALALRADLWLAQGRADAAEAAWRDVLKVNPSHEASLDALATLLTRQGRSTELAQLLPAAEVAKYQVSLDRARAGQMRREADDLVAAGQRADAVALLRQAVQLDATNPWLRYDLARQLQQLGQSAEADAVAAPLLDAGEGDQSGHRYAYALYAASLDRTDAALAALEGIPVEQRSEGMLSLNRRLELERALAALAPGATVSAGQRAQARADAERLSAGDPALSYRFASALLRAGDATQARALLDARAAEAEQAGAKDAMEWRLRQAALYDQVPDETALSAAITRLQAHPQLLTDAQHADLSALRQHARVREIEALRERGNYPAARQLTMNSLVEWQNAPALQLQQAGIELDDQQTDQAAALYGKLLQARPDWTEATLGLADALAAGGQSEEARRLLDDLAARQPAVPDALIARGRLAERLGERQDARRWYERALAAEGRPLPDPVPVEAEFAGSSAERALVRLEKRRDGYVETGVIYRSKAGQDGLSTTRVSEIPTEFFLPVGYDGHLIGHVDQVDIQAGNLPTSLADQARFGQMLARSPGGIPATGQSGSGTAVGLGYEDDHWRVDLGSTPLGFLVTNWVGGFRYSDADARHYSSLELFRRPVTSSLLSYAGQRDPATGAVWGGVVRTGGSFRFSFSEDGITRALSGRAALLQGRHVADNNELRLVASQSHDLIHRRDMELTAGVSGTFWHFQRDLSNFTYGHGGYYSPQQYLSLALPVRWTGRWHDWAYLLEPSVGVSWARSAATPYYPTDAGLQAQAETNAGLNPVLPAPSYAGSSGTSLSYTLQGALEKRLAPNWFVGGGFRLDRSPYYTPNVFQLYLRYELKPKQGLVEYPPRLIRPYSEF